MSIDKRTIIENIKNFEKDFNSSTLVNLFKEVFSTFNYDSHITYKTTTPDPFLIISKPTETKPYNLDNIYDWYLSKNEKFRENGQTIKAANPVVPEFKITLALILKDLMLLLIGNKFPTADENDTDDTGFEKCCVHIKTLSGTDFSNIDNQFEKHNLIYEVLIQLKNIIEKGYYYLEIIELIINYYKLFNFGYLNEDIINKQTYNKLVDGKNIYTNGKQCILYLNILRNLSDTYFMIYPSFPFVSYTKILYFLQRPVLMLKMANIREFTDGYWMSPITQIWHDITFHSHITHCLKTKDERDLLNTQEGLQRETNNIYRNIDNVYDNVFRKKFEIIKKYINVNYKNLNSDDLKLSMPERIKYYISYILFLFLHEADYNDGELLYTKCTILNINNLEIKLKALLEKPSQTKFSVFLQKKITSKSIKNKLIDKLLEELPENDKEFKRFTLIENNGNNGNNNLKTKNMKKIVQSYDRFIEEINKMFEELKLVSSNTQEGGYKHISSHKKTKKQKFKSKLYKSKIKHKKK